jgi:hypothetical protein
MKCGLLLFFVVSLQVMPEAFERFVGTSFCHKEGIGSWLQRTTAAPLVIASACPGFLPLFKGCDLRGHDGISFADFFVHRLFTGTMVPPRVDDELHNRIFKTRDSGKVHELSPATLAGPVEDICKQLMFQNASHVLINTDALFLNGNSVMRRMLQLRRPLNNLLAHSTLPFTGAWAMSFVVLSS